LTLDQQRSIPEAVVERVTIAPATPVTVDELWAFCAK
jgi:hypothetical protein